MLIYERDGVEAHHGETREILRSLPDRSVHVVVTSPPYYGLRDYEIEPSIWGGDPLCAHRWDGDSTSFFCAECRAWRGLLGLEPTPDLYVEHLIEVFREIRRVLRDDGTLWLNLGDCYNAAGRTGYGTQVGAKQGTNRASALGLDSARAYAPDLKPKDLIGIPWRVAFALQDDGWYLRRDLVWEKPNAMPESVKDRPSTVHEYIFILSKGERYYYDGYPIREPLAEGSIARIKEKSFSIQSGGSKDYDRSQGGHPRSTRRAIENFRDALEEKGLEIGRNSRSVWSIPTEPEPAAHFAVFPREIPRRAIAAGSSPYVCAACGAPYRRVTDELKAKGSTSKTVGRKRTEQTSGYTFPEMKGWAASCDCGAPVGKAVVLDPFAGSFTSGAVAVEGHRRFIGIDASKKNVREIGVPKMFGAAEGLLAETIEEIMEGF